MNKLTAKGNWNLTKGKLKQKFAQLSDADLNLVKGKEEEWLGRLQKVTGESRDALIKLLES